MKQRMLLLLLLLTASLLVAPGPTLAQQDERAEANVAPNTGEAGTEFGFSAGGFAPNDVISVWLNRPDGQSVEAEVENLGLANARGWAYWTWRAPEQVQPGRWEMVAYGQSSQTVHVIPFEITATPTSAVAANVEPKSGPGGTRFGFAAGGFAEYDVITVWLNRPDGQSVPADVQDLGGANALGNAFWLWTAPQNAQPGRWEMVAYGQKSEVVQVIPFEIEGVEAAPQEANVEPKSGTSITRFGFYAGGYAPFESLSIWVNRPDGQAVAVEVDNLGTTDSLGRAFWSWLPPGDAQPGRWEMVAHGRTSGVTNVIAFEIIESDIR